MLQDLGAQPSNTALTPTPQRSLDEAWRTTEFLPLQRVAILLGVSRSGVYNLRRAGTLKFRRIAGRTVVVTRDVATLVDTAEEWKPSAAGAAARAHRAQTVKANREAGVIAPRVGDVE